MKITEAWSASNVESKIMWIKADRETIALMKHVKAEAQKKKQLLNIEFMEFTPRNHQKIRNEIKEHCNKLRAFNKYWWTKVVPGEPGNPNYQIEVSHADCHKFIRVDYDTVMSIPLDESDPAEPGSGKKGAKRTKGYQKPDELKTFRDTMREIDANIVNAYAIAFDALKEQPS